MTTDHRQGLPYIGRLGSNLTLILCLGVLLVGGVLGVVMFRDKGRVEEAQVKRQETRNLQFENDMFVLDNVVPAVRKILEKHNICGPDCANVRYVNSQETTWKIITTPIGVRITMRPDFIIATQQTFYALQLDYATQRKDGSPNDMLVVGNGLKAIMAAFNFPAEFQRHECPARVQVGQSTYTCRERPFTVRQGGPWDGTNTAPRLYTTERIIEMVRRGPFTKDNPAWQTGP